VRTLRIIIVVALALGVVGRTSSAQMLTFSLFDRYLDSLRQEVGIPGLSAAIVKSRRVAWDRGLGLSDIARAVAARPDTPYPIDDLTQTFAATILLQQCVDRGSLEITDRVQRWVPDHPNGAATVGQLLTHTSSGGFAYDPERYAGLTSVVVECSDGDPPFRKLVAQQIFDQLGMSDSVPGLDIVDPATTDRRYFDAASLTRYGEVLRRLAVPYRVSGNRTATRSEYPTRTLDASRGLISSVLDLADYDAALDDGILVRRETLAEAWAGSGSRPTGHGWFVQSYNGERLVWHFGSTPNAFSSLILKVPGRELTLVLLANSDGLSEPFALRAGDVTRSVFAKLFLRLFVA
jgi:CubicO group peptidase (beta-lactamase class C family)